MEVIVKDKPDSVKVSQNAKGDYAFEVKIYLNNEDYEETVQRIDDIYVLLHGKFK